MTQPAVCLDEIRLLEEGLHRPEVRRSRPALEELLADEFVEFGASGTVCDRAAIIDLLVEEDAEREDGDLQTSDYALIGIAPGAVLLTYRTQRIGSDGSGRQVLRSSIWKHGGSAWQMVFHQGTVAKHSVDEGP